MSAPAPMTSIRSFRMTAEPLNPTAPISASLHSVSGVTAMLENCAVAAAPASWLVNAMPASTVAPIEIVSPPMTLHTEPSSDV